MKKYYLGVDDIRTNLIDNCIGDNPLQSIDVVLNDQIHRYNTNSYEWYMPDKHGQEVFDLVEKISNMDYLEREAAFDKRYFNDILALGYTTVRDKYEAWENRIKVGDEITDTIRIGIVVNVCNNGKGFYCLEKGSGKTLYFSLRDSTKTGKRFDDIAKYCGGE